MPSTMKDYVALPSGWTQITRGSANPVVIQNFDDASALVFVGGSAPGALVNKDARRLQAGADIEMTLLSDDLIFVKAVGDRPVVVNVWFG